MRIQEILMPNRSWRIILFLALGYFMTGTYVQAQASCGTTQGLNAVYGTCNSTGTQGSIATVDASQFSGDICSQIQASFTAYASSHNTYGVVVDARGIGPGTTQTCTGGNPWATWTAGALPSVVLLPSGTIKISSTWAMPELARLIGEGSGVTILQATTSFGDMIDMGNTSLCTNHDDCPGIAIEHLGLSGGTNGIVNNNAQELSYVEDVAFSDISGNALWLDGSNAWNSGPYSKLTMSNVGTCVSINGTEDTRGIHGLTCSTSGSSEAAIYVDGANNSLEDISIYNTGTTTNGILIGDAAAAQNNVLFNIRGSGFTYLINLSGSKSMSQTNCPGTGQLPNTGQIVAYNVCDITIVGVTNQTSGSTTIYDQVSGSTLTDSHLGMYILGEPVQYGSSNNYFLGNSQFTTSPNSPTWIVGSNQQVSNACPSVGSLYSVTSGPAPTLLECESLTSGLFWATVK